jgi:hypothetical protein
MPKTEMVWEEPITHKAWRLVPINPEQSEWRFGPLDKNGRVSPLTAVKFTGEDWQAREWARGEARQRGLFAFLDYTDK